MKEHNWHQRKQNQCRRLEDQKIEDQEKNRKKIEDQEKFYQVTWENLNTISSKPKTDFYDRK